ncbi:unnamed protein product [Diatraea saccharalis]|uniref:Uncharacterized protein n=1 Tax=Diatraea saccharalis TaxID=40085 RepID=A0A9N9QYW3_9NEOP|nr:unnamed protein product [Diatraea saccharalis]
MVDSSPLKSDEQYPLLKVETGGGGDSGRSQPSVVTPGWHVAGSPKRSWLDRWPELISAFWMSGMLLGIFCLMLYGLGLGVIKRQPVLMLHCKTPKPGSDVYYHHIFQHGSPVPFSKFSEYLSYMASLYSSLHFNVIFLMDDTYPSDYRGRHSRFLNKFMPNHFKIGEHIDENNQKEFKDFHTRHQNVNITVTTLSKYMAMTPLKYKWRAIPIGYLTFYARAFSVWRSGGIGIDLETFSSQFNRRQLPDRRISEIFKQHNNGIKPDEYTNSLNNIDREEQNEFASLFYGIIHQILNETRALLNRTLHYSEASIEKDQTFVEPLVRTHRNKRELNRSESQSDNNAIKNNFTTEIAKVVNTTNPILINVTFGNIRVTANNSNISSAIESVVPITKQIDGNGNQKTSRNNFKYIRKNMSESPQILFLYDFSLFSDSNLGPSYLLPEPMIQANFPVTLNFTEHESTPDNNSKLSPYILSINIEGTFVAASLKQHPFLGHIISARCQRMPPRFVIQDAMTSQCSNMLRDDFYCSNIYLLY